jgi:hypothetical protein
VDTLNTREWAIVIWLLILAVFLLSQRAVRASSANVLRAMLQPKLVALFSAMWLYIAGCVTLLALVGLWDVDQTKNTILWAILAAPPVVARFATHASAPQLVRGWISDTFTLTVVIELVALTYTFPLWGELILVPVLALVSGMLAVAGNDPKYAPVKSLLEALMAVVVFGLIGWGVYMIVVDWKAFATMTTLRDTYIAPLLSFATIPFVFGSFLYSRYDSMFSVLRVYIDDPKLRDYASTLGLIAFNVKTSQLQRWKQEIVLTKPSTRDAVKESIKKVLRGTFRKKAGKTVPPDEGWHPSAASQFLAKHGFPTGDYHESFGDWLASSQPKEITGGLWAHNLAYYIEGDEEAVRQLRLKLNINGPDDRDAALRQFQDVGQVLLVEGAAPHHLETIPDKLANGEPFSEVAGGTRISLVRETFPNHHADGYALLLDLRRTKRIHASSSATLHPRPA